MPSSRALRSAASLINDGNKRTGFACALVFLASYSVKLSFALHRSADYYLERTLAM